jgi:hypothetical protein
MALWEVNDEMGTEVVKSFYKNLLKGQRKSEALRNAKLQFIYSKGSNQFRGNPFYWATLVVYGNNGPVFHNLSQALFLLLAALIFVASSLLIFKGKKSNQKC